ncbi:MAG TPA: hypothetical protein PLL95_00965, partial [Anaerolineales bacterium]|nr:hypothetical protein [Anaerolineales bacterium]
NVQGEGGTLDVARPILPKWQKRARVENYEISEGLIREVVHSVDRFQWTETGKNRRRGGASCNLSRLFKLSAVTKNSCVLCQK